MPKLPDFRYQISEKESPTSGIRKGFTLVEITIAVTIIAILASATIVAINPAKRSRQARDALRMSDINAIANALVGYFHNKDEYPPATTRCETSRGITYPLLNCNLVVPDPGDKWSTNSQLYIRLVQNEGFIKTLPIDPKNNSTYYYRYLGFGGDEDECFYDQITPKSCQYFWVGARLEDVDNPAKQGKMVFRCSNAEPSLIVGTPGCKIVELNTDLFPFDYNYPFQYNHIDECIPTSGPPCN